jgi:hypothetical protein
MSRPPVFLALLVLATATPVWACGEGRFNTGGGLSNQGYLAPRPATVLILDEAADAKDEALYAGLQRAGHKVTVVHDSAALDAALAGCGVDPERRRQTLSIDEWACLTDRIAPALA